MKDTIKGSEFYYSNKDGLHFRSDNHYVWSAFPKWIVADLNDDNCYVNHQQFSDLEEAIKNCLFRSK